MINTDYFDRISKRLLIKDPFYGLLLMSLAKRFTDKENECSTLGVYREGINYAIIVNTEFFNGLSEEQAISVLKHEACHCFQNHLTEMFTGSMPNHRMANYAADLSINQMLTDLPDGCINYAEEVAKYPDLKPQEGTRYYYKYYASLPQERQPQGGFGENGSTSQSSGMGDHSHWKDFQDLSEAEKELVKVQADGILKHTAEQCQKMRGTVPAEFEEKIKELFKPKEQVFNWKAYFRRLLGTAEEWERKSTRKRPSRRFEDAPGSKHKHKQKILVAVDTSGSVSMSELEDFFSEINYIWKAGAQIDVLEYDAKVNKVWQYKGKAPTTVTGRGGTIWDEAYRWYVPRMRDYSAFVTFTDGYDRYEADSGLRNGIFVVTSNGDKKNKYPGKTIFIPRE